MARFRYKVTPKKEVNRIIDSTDKATMHIEMNLGSVCSYWLRQGTAVLARMSKSTFKSLKLNEVDNPFINQRTFKFPSP